MAVDGKVIIVTGISSGIGLATGKALLASGAKVFGIDIQPLKDETLLSTVVSSFVFHECNLTAPNAAEEAVRAAASSFGGRIDGLANVAGIMDNNASVDMLDDSQWDRVIAVNLTAPVKLMREVVKVMKHHGGGSIVNVASKAGMSGAVAGVAYTASKHGLVGATKNVAWRFHDEGIRCNAVAPGGVASNIMNSVEGGMRGLDPEGSKVCGPVQQLHMTDVSKIMMPEQVASVITFLLSDASVGMSGSIIPIDQAWSTI